MNTYKKYCPNVFVAKCEEEHQKNDIITMTTKYGREHEVRVWNLVHTDKEGNFYYSITREDGYDYQAHMQAKADRYKLWAGARERKGNERYEASKEGADFLALGEPIKVGHHSEKRHRALIDRNWNRLGQAVENWDKAKEHKAKAEYWEARASQINLSMPESLEFFEHKLEEATMEHAGLKDGSIPRRHSYSLTYANKKKKEMADKLATAKKLWGNV